MNDQEDRLIATQTPEEIAAEEAEFLKGFSAEATSEPEPEPKAEPTPEPEPKAEAEPKPEPPKAVLAGLTEDQVAQALARVSQQQATLDKLGGRIGALMQQVEKLKEAPRTASEQRQFDLKLEKLGAAFPELAELLREDLKGIGDSAPAAPAEPAPQTFTAEDVDRILSEKLTAFQKQQERAMEVKVLSSAHPDWNNIIRTPQFALWRDNVIEDGTALMESEDASFISRKLTEFKDWVKATQIKQPPAPAAKAAQAPTARLRQAVRAETTPTPATRDVSEEDAFVAAFKREREKSGY